MSDHGLVIESSDWSNMNPGRAADIKAALFILEQTAPTSELYSCAKRLAEAFAAARGQSDLVRREREVMDERRD